jgi:hypothetical protein
MVYIMIKQQLFLQHNYGLESIYCFRDINSHESQSKFSKFDSGIIYGVSSLNGSKSSLRSGQAHTCMPARLPDTTPAKESSNTKQSVGFAPSLCAATR